MEVRPGEDIISTSRGIHLTSQPTTNIRPEMLEPTKPIRRLHLRKYKGRSAVARYIRSPVGMPEPEERRVDER